MFCKRLLLSGHRSVLSLNRGQNEVEAEAFDLGSPWPVRCGLVVCSEHEYSLLDDSLVPSLCLE
jgi:hypothetical protein